jgi:predicted amidohydrolase
VAERIVVACVQQRMHLPLTVDDYRDDLRRFMRVASTKHARLVVFPELGGVMVAPPILRDFRSQLLKRYDRGRRRNAPLWDRMVGGFAGSLVSMVGADFRRGLAALLDVAAQEIWQTYESVFGGLAREFAITVVAPSAYLPDPVDGVIPNLSVVFDSNGQIIGRQSKVVLHPADTDLAQPGSTWNVIATEVGQLGLILGSDVLYPEVGRLLAYQGADFLVVQAACTDETLYQKIRVGALARMQDNQLFAALSFLVGNNLLSRAQRTPFAGKSAIFAPQELSPRSNGVLVEMGNLRSEGVLAAMWDFASLRELWETSDTPLRRQLPLQQAGQLLAQLYARLQELPKVADLQQLEQSDIRETSSAKQELVATQSLDDLAVIATVTQAWPPVVEATTKQEYDPIEGSDEDFVITATEVSDEYMARTGENVANTSAGNAGDANLPSLHEEVQNGVHPVAVQENGEQGEASHGETNGSLKTGDDETDEMDAVAGSDKIK